MSNSLQRVSAGHIGSIIDQMLEEFFSPTPINIIRREYEVGSPVGDVLCNEKGDMRFTFAITGFNEKEVDVSIEDGILLIKGTKENDSDEVSKDGFEYFSRRVARRNFERSVSLPKRLDIEKAEMKIVNGELIITIPAREKSIKKLTLSK